MKFAFGVYVRDPVVGLIVTVPLFGRFVIVTEPGLRLPSTSTSFETTFITIGFS